MTLRFKDAEEMRKYGVKVPGITDIVPCVSPPPQPRARVQGIERVLWVIVGWLFGFVIGLLF